MHLTIPHYAYVLPTGSAVATAISLLYRSLRHLDTCLVAASSPSGSRYRSSRWCGMAISI